MCSALLVAFSCSCPVYAIDTTQPISFKVACSSYSLTMGSTSTDSNYYGTHVDGYFSAPLTDAKVVNSFKFQEKTTNVAINSKVKSSKFVFTADGFPYVDYDRWVVVAVGYRDFGTYSYSSGYQFDVQYQTYASDSWKTLSKACRHIQWFKAGTTDIDLVEIKIPAGSTVAKCSFPASYYNTAYYNTNEFMVFSAWVYDDHSFIDIMTDMLSELKEINANTDTIIPLLQSIDGTTSNIYDLLYKALKDESKELSDETKKTAETIMQQEDGSRYWNDKNTENFNAIGLDNFQFSGSIVSGFGVVGGIFEGLWNALGDASVIYLFPLVLGVALVVIGRVARSGGGGKKKDGDGE